MAKETAAHREEGGKIRRGGEEGGREGKKQSREVKWQDRGSKKSRQKQKGKSRKRGAKRKERRTQRKEGESINENNELKKCFHPCFLTCALLGAAWPLAVHSQLTAKVFLPELSEPHVPAVVGQRSALEVSVKRCEENQAYVIRMWPRNVVRFFFCFFLSSPSTDALLGRIVTAPSATRSCWTTGEILEPQLSEPTHRKWPVKLWRFAASSIRLNVHRWDRWESRRSVLTYCLEFNKSLKPFAS